MFAGLPQVAEDAREMPTTPQDVRPTVV